MNSESFDNFQYTNHNLGLLSNESNIREQKSKKTNFLVDSLAVQHLQNKHNIFLSNNDSFVLTEEVNTTCYQEATKNAVCVF